MPESERSAAPTMQAIVQSTYGDADVLRVAEVDRPTVGDREVLVAVHAAAVQRGDDHLMRGSPLLLRLMGFGLRRPRRAIPGQDLAGTVEAVGAGVGSLRVGDAVFGSGHGAFAEYAVVPETALAPMPAGATFEQAAAVPHGGLAALQALRDAARVRGGQRVLVLGAAGAVGSAAVQIARSLGAEVTGVCRAAQVEQVRELGAQRVIAIDVEDFAAEGPRYDAVVDTVGWRPLGALRRALVRGGRAVMVAGGGGRWLGGMERVLFGALTSVFASRKLVPFVATPRRDDLIGLAKLVADGALTPTVERSFPLAATADAFRHLASRRTTGAIVVVPRGSAR